MIESDYSNGVVKKVINELIWKYAHPKLTLGEAEEIATNFHNELYRKFCSLEKIFISDSNSFDD